MSGDLSNLLIEFAQAKRRAARAAERAAEHARYDDSENVNALMEQMGIIEEQANRAMLLADRILVAAREKLEQARRR